VSARAYLRMVPCAYCCKGLTPEALASHTRAECEAVLSAWSEHDPKGAQPALEALRAVRWAEVMA